MPNASTTRPAPTHRGRRRVWRIEVAVRGDLLDPAGEEAHAELAALGIPAKAVRVTRLWFVQTQASAAVVERAAREVLADPVQDHVAIDASLPAPRGWREVTVQRKPGVMNPEAESARIALRTVGLDATQVHSARTYGVQTRAPAARVLAAARRALGNDVIEDVEPGRPTDYTFARARPARARRRTVKLRTMTGTALETLSAKAGLSLSRLEMETIRDHFRDLGRDPTDVELETLAQTWSEHCKHKTLAGAVHMQDDTGERHYDNLLKETVFEATRKLGKSWCWSVFKDNAGVIDFDGDTGVCMKVETHNHPSAIEPYGGAGTGIGGVIRDILGTGLGARPIANTDVFCFGDPSLEESEVPQGAMHPLRLLKGVVAGVRDYGNRMGIPTVNGAICFDPRYVGNPVVYAGCVGLIPRKYVEKAARPGDLIVAFGGRTGRDGIHGATFSSDALHAESETVSSGAVQIGDPITEKKVLDVLLQARDRGTFHAVTDCGAGGFSSAVGEMGEDVGADVDLSGVPLKYPGLEAFEIWISEAQERMVAAIAPRRWPAFEKLCAAEDVEAVVLGSFTGDQVLRVRHGATLLAELDMAFLHDGLPRVVRTARYEAPTTREPSWRPKASYTKDLLALLGMPQIGSKEWVIRQYDHEVQAGAVVRPLVGPEHGPSDAAVIAPTLGSHRGVVLSNGLNPAYGDLDPYAMAWAAVDEAVRNAVAVGADPARLALLDNFTWGDCRREETLGTIVRAAEGCRDAALAFGAPFISGKDSLNNEFRTDSGEHIIVPPTLLISAISVIADVRKTCTSDLKAAGNGLYLVGTTFDECGGSHWYRWRGRTGAHVPRVRPEAPGVLRAVSRVVRRGWVRAAHDLSEGGLAVAAAEMALGSRLGCTLDLRKVDAATDHPGRILFSESTTRLLLEVAPAHRAAFEQALRKAHVGVHRVGRVTRATRLTVRGPDGTPCVDVDVDRLRKAWRDALPVGRAASPKTFKVQGEGR